MEEWNQKKKNNKKNVKLMNDLASAVFQLATNGSMAIDLAGWLFWTRAFCFNSFNNLTALCSVSLSKFLTRQTLP